MKFNVVLVYNGSDSSGVLENLTPNKSYPTEKIRTGHNHSYVLMDDRGSSLMISDGRKEKFFQEEPLPIRVVV